MADMTLKVCRGIFYIARSVYVNNKVSSAVRMVIDHVALAKQGDNGIGSVRPSICLCVGGRDRDSDLRIVGLAHYKPGRTLLLVVGCAQTVAKFCSCTKLDMAR